MTDFAEIGQAREKMLSIKLEQMQDSVAGSSTIDPKGYLSGLNSQILKTDAEIGSVHRNRGEFLLMGLEIVILNERELYYNL